MPSQPQRVAFTKITQSIKPDDFKHTCTFQLSSVSFAKKEITLFLSKNGIEKCTYKKKMEIYKRKVWTRAGMRNVFQTFCSGKRMITMHTKKTYFTLTESSSFSTKHCNLHKSFWNTHIHTSMQFITIKIINIKISICTRWFQVLHFLST